VHRRKRPERSLKNRSGTPALQRMCRKLFPNEVGAEIYAEHELVALIHLYLHLEVDLNLWLLQPPKVAWIALSAKDRPSGRSSMKPPLLQRHSHPIASRDPRAGEEVEVTFYTHHYPKLDVPRPSVSGNLAQNHLHRLLFQHRVHSVAESDQDLSPLTHHLLLLPRTLPEWLHQS
jgi:hypothetical protein